MRQPPFDEAKLRTLLDDCYRYVGVLDRENHSPASPDVDDDSGSGPEYQPKLYKRPQHRPKGKVELAEWVRREMGVLLGQVGPDDGDDVDFVAKPLSSVSDMTLESWKRSHSTGPTVENFVLQLRDGKVTKWNKAAARVFSRYFRSKYPDSNLSTKDLETAFFAHLPQLKTVFDRQGRDKTIDEKDGEQRARRLRRRHAVCFNQVDFLICILK